MKKFFLTLLVVAVIISSFVTVEAKKFGDNYQLDKVLIFSRHNIRSPNIDRSRNLTPNKWFKWTAASGELSLRGGLLETSMGQYFRKYFVDENFMTENYQPTADEFRFYANSLQRTVATAKYFSSGLLPVANVEIEHALPIGNWDDVFNAKFNFMDEKYLADVTKNLKDYCGVDDLRFAGTNLKNEIALLENVLDFKNSRYARKTGETSLRTNATEFILEPDKVPSFRGSMLPIYSAADALIMQYYETGAAFDKKLSESQRHQIGTIKEFSIGMIGIKNIAINVSQPLMKFLCDEIASDRKFSFVCGHDSNINEILSALDAEEYSLPETIEYRAPIGGKILIERWKNISDGQNYASLSLVYMSDAQIRNLSPFTLKNPPKIYPLRLKGLQTNSDGLYLFSDVEKRFSDALAEYDALKNG
ncbi:MAG: histidine-type phosphatase [Selenomonadaceae bacterium]|nr:histidine-type phosphatase [Selenomonadaceae bacterium]